MLKSRSSSFWSVPFEDRGRLMDEYLAAFKELATKDKPSYGESPPALPGPGTRVDHPQRSYSSPALDPPFETHIAQRQVREVFRRALLSQAFAEAASAAMDRHQ
jgi:hypothetical protein